MTLSVGHRLYSDEPGGPYYYYSISTSTAITTTATITTTTMTNFRLILSWLNFTNPYDVWQVSRDYCPIIKRTLKYLNRWFCTPLGSLQAILQNLYANGSAVVQIMLKGRGQMRSKDRWKTCKLNVVLENHTKPLLFSLQIILLFKFPKSSASPTSRSAGSNILVSSLCILPVHNNSVHKVYKHICINLYPYV